MKAIEPSFLCPLFFIVQETLDDLKLIVRGSLSQVETLQDCFLPQTEPPVQYSGKVDILIVGKLNNST